MQKTTFTLISRRALTHDVYELVYSCTELSKEPPKPGQYAMFLLALGLSRAYSIASCEKASFTLIIKRIADGRWSPMICDAGLGSVFSGMIPLGHFILQDTPKHKCFIGTGTGFAPLYAMVLECAKTRWNEGNIFLYGVREERDFFYFDEMEKLVKETHLTLRPYLSRADATYATHGYVTDWITSDNIMSYEEFYICGSPSMVESARNKLMALGIMKKQIFWEQY